MRNRAAHMVKAGSDSLANPMKKDMPSPLTPILLLWSILTREVLINFVHCLEAWQLHLLCVEGITHVVAESRFLERPPAQSRTMQPIG